VLETADKAIRRKAGTPAFGCKNNSGDFISHQEISEATHITVS